MSKRCDKNRSGTNKIVHKVKINKKNKLDNTINRVGFEVSKQTVKLTETFTVTTKSGRVSKSPARNDFIRWSSIGQEEGMSSDNDSSTEVDASSVKIKVMAPTKIDEDADMTPESRSLSENETILSSCTGNSDDACSMHSFGESNYDNNINRSLEEIKGIKYNKDVEHCPYDSFFKIF